MLTLILTNSARHLRPRLRRVRGLHILLSETNADGARLFPDGEVYVCLPQTSMSRARVVVLHSGVPHPNRGLMELEMILAVLRRSGVERVEVFFAYMPYGMQDKIGRRGETNAAEDLLRKLVSFYGVQTIYAIDPHFGSAPWLAPFPFTTVSAHECLLAAARRKFPDTLFIAPDEGHAARTRKVKGLRKTRANSYTVHIAHDMAFFRAFEGKTVGVVDDIIETGGTFAKFHETVLPYKPRKMFAVATHGVLPSGVARVQEMYGELFLSNTVDTPAANVDITPLIIEALTHHA